MPDQQEKHRAVNMLQRVSATTIKPAVSRRHSVEIFVGYVIFETKKTISVIKEIVVLPVDSVASIQ